MKVESVKPDRLQRYGINTRQLTTLLGVYLKQDLRGNKSFLQMNRGEHSANYALLTVAALHMFIGLSLAFIALTGMDVFLFSITTMSATLFIVALGLLSESGNVIFNESETDVLGHLPIGARTYFAAKTINLLAFAFLLAVTTNIFPAVFGAFASGSRAMFIFAHGVSTLLAAVFGTTVLVTSYGFIMRFVSKERLDNAVAYAQIALALLFMLSYQLVPRLSDRYEIAETYEFHWYLLLYPPAWFAGLAMATIGRADSGTLSLALLSLLSVGATGVIAFRKMSLAYSPSVREHALPQVKPGQENVAATQALTASRPSASFTPLILRSPVERAVFTLVSTYFRRNREVKIRLYPALAYFILFPVLMLFTDRVEDPFLVPQSGLAFLACAMICFVSLTAIESLVFSNDYQAAYIFHLTPITRLGHIYSGIRKFVAAYIALPAFVALFAIFAVAWRAPLHAFLLLLPWIIATPAVLIVPFTFRQILPLSRKYQKGQQSARNLTVFIFSGSVLAGIGSIQAAGIRGWIPYWLSIAIIAAGSAVLYFALRLLSGESRPLSVTDR